jgi:hypothetical protein
MKRVKDLFRFLLSAALLMGIAVSGCSGLGQWGRLGLQPQGEGKVTPEQLAKTWKEYNVYFAGIVYDKPSALIFDPKGDGKTLQVHPWWERVEDEKTLQEILTWMGFRKDFDPVVWRILGPKGDFYGYMYTAWNHARIKSVDENTICQVGG